MAASTFAPRTQSPGSSRCVMRASHLHQLRAASCHGCSLCGGPWALTSEALLYSMANGSSSKAMKSSDLLPFEAVTGGAGTVLMVSPG